jgi:hypothetical protein
MRRVNDEFGPGIDVIYGIPEGGGSEVQAIRFDKKKFTVAEAKAWLKRSGYKPIEFEPAADESKAKANCCRAGECVRLQKAEVHDALLQLLNRQVGSDFFTVEPFEETIDEWEGVPLIFASKHPNFQVWSKAVPVRELLKVNGAVVGHIAKPTIESTGHPKFMGQMVFSDEKAKGLLDSGEITQEIFDRTEDALKTCSGLLGEGLLSHSTAFSCKSDKEGNLIANPPLVPNHVLVFEETDEDQPKDRGAVILNQTQLQPELQEATVPDKERHTNEGRVISTVNRSKFKQALDILHALFSSMTESGDGAGMLKQETTTPQSKPNSNAETKSNAAYPWDQCISDMLDEGYDEATANSICAAIKNRTVTHAMQFGLAKNEKEARKLIAKKVAEDQLFGYLAGRVSDLYREKHSKEKSGKSNQEGKMDDELKKQLAEKDAALKELDEKIKNMTAEIDEFKKKQTEAETAAKEAAWEQEKKKLKEGLIHTEEQEKEMKELFMTNPYTYLQKAEYLGDPADPKSKASGDRHTNKGGVSETPEEKRNRILSAEGRAIPGTLHRGE